MAVIKSGASTDQLSVDATSKAARVTLYNSSGTELSSLPVSGSVSVSNFPVTQPVSISGSVPVTGTVSVGNFPATQPISGAVSVSNFPASQAVTGTFFQATQPVSGTFFQATQPISGAVSVSNTVPTTAADTLSKGVQGATGFSVQSLIDAGRSIKTFSAFNASSVVSEALMTLTPQTDGTNGSTGTSFTVTSGKRLRLQQIVLSARPTTAAVVIDTFILRMSSSGAVTITSPVIMNVNLTGPAAVIGAGAFMAISLPDGFELSGTQQFGISHVGTIATYVENVSLIGYEY
jgi:hypothetical protein